MRIAYFDCFCGASGDMILGALVDAGISPDYLTKQIAKLGLSHYEVSWNQVSKRGLRGTQATVVFDKHHHDRHHRKLREIVEIIVRSNLERPLKRSCLKIFTRLAQAEGRVHRASLHAIHFHEVGAVDAIIDVVGAVVGLAALGVQQVFCSPLPLGTGTVACEHGIMPVPAPATAELVKDKPVCASPVKGELLTPTGAAILTTVAREFGPMPAMTIRSIGYGAGKADFPLPNLLRLFVGDLEDSCGGLSLEQIAVIETNIDDMNPQIYEYLIQKLLAQGALDVFLTPVYMKKNRPGIVVTVICPPNQIYELSRVLIQETTSIGIRYHLDYRYNAERKLSSVQTTYGDITVKVAEADGHVVNIAPEYDDCKRVALEHGIPLKSVLDQVKATALKNDKGRL